MRVSLEELDVLKSAEEISDGIWKLVIEWQKIERDTIEKQLTRATDSIGANIAEAYGRFHFGEKLRFLNNACGSPFETKYWLNRCATRTLLAKEQVKEFTSQLTKLARQINAFAINIKIQQDQAASRKIGESEVEYSALTSQQTFSTEDDLAAISNP